MIEYMLASQEELCSMWLAYGYYPLLLVSFHSDDSCNQMPRNQMPFSSHLTASSPSVVCIQFDCCYRFLLKALDLFWHEDCLKCGCCDCRLGEVGSTLYTKADLILCRRDYLRYVHPSLQDPF